MIFMENGKMDSSSKVSSDSIISCGKSIKSCLNNDSSVTFSNTNSPNIETTFSSCNGNSAMDLRKTVNLVNGVNACNNNCEENSYSASNRINSSQCNLNSIQSSVCSSIENTLSTLIIKTDSGEALSDLINCKKCDKYHCQDKLSRDCRNCWELQSQPDSTFVKDTSANNQDVNEIGKEGENSSEVVYISYESEHQMPDIMKLIQKDLSEPYSIYTYRYFIHNWPHLCFLAVCKGKSVGAIVCKLDIHRKVIKRGYIAMLAVDESYRKHGIGSNLVLKAIRVMAAEGADEVVLETEITNQPALRLYENLGFVRDKRLFRYYLNGVDALRLKLWLR